MARIYLDTPPAKTPPPRKGKGGKRITMSPRGAQSVPRHVLMPVDGIIDYGNIDIPKLRKMNPKVERAIVIESRIKRKVDDKSRKYGITRDGGSSSPFRIIGGGLVNFANDGMKLVTGTSRLGWEVLSSGAEAVAGPFVPGASSKAAGSRLLTLGKGAAAGLKQDVQYVTEPILKGDPMELARRFYKEPVRVGTTVGGLWSAAGGALRLGLRGAGVATGNAALKDFASKRYVPRPDMKTPRRYREPEVVTAPVDRANRRVIPGPATVKKKLPPRSANILTREIQVGTDAVLNRVKKSLAKNEWRVNPMSGSKRYNRLVARNTRDEGFKMMEHADNQILMEAQPFQRLVRKAASRLGGGKRGDRASRAYYTAAVRSMGLNNLSRTKTSRTWGRDALIKQYEKQLDYHQNHEYGNPDFARMIEENIAGLKSIPDEWLDPATAPKLVNDLTGEMSKLLDRSTQMKVAAGVIRPSTAERSGYRAQEAAAGVFDEGSAMRRAIVARKAAAQKAVVSKAQIDRFTNQIAQIKMQMKNATDDASRRQLQSSLQRTQDNLTKAKRNATLAKTREAEAKLSEDTNRRIVDDALGGMEPGKYFPNFRMKQPGITKRVGDRPLFGESPRMTLPVVRQNEGSIIRQGTMAFTPDVTMLALRDAVDITQRANAVTSMMEQYVVRGRDGKPVTGDAAVRLAQQSNDLYVAKTKKELIKILRADADYKASELNLRPGEDMNVIPRRSVNEADELSLLDELADMPDGDTRYLLPRAAEVGWREALGRHQNLFDDLNKYWKAGVLAVNPRWYIQNFFGMWAQFGVGAGLDLKAIQMALNKKKYMESVLPEIQATGLSQYMGEYARSMTGTGGANPLARLFNWGYRANSKLEGIPRRAMQWHAARKGMSENEFIRMRDKPEFMAQAWDEVAKAAGEGDEWANALIDNVIKETDRFMGNYSRFNKIEQTVLRRVFPFYAWMRAINRLIFTLPFKYPKRAALLQSASRAVYEMYSDEESDRVGIPGIIGAEGGFLAGPDEFVGSSVFNPVETGRQSLQLLGKAGSIMEDGGWGGVLQLPAAAAQSAYTNVSPVVSLLPTTALNTSPIGVPQFFSPGYGNAFRGYGNEPVGPDPVTGQIGYSSPTSGLDTMIGGNIPIYNTLKKILSEGNTPNTDTNLFDLFRYRFLGDDSPETMSRIFRPPNEKSVLQRTTRGEVLGALGFPVYGYNPKMSQIDQIKMAQRYKDAFLQELIRKKKAERAFRRRR